jgi:hypothetical protein
MPNGYDSVLKRAGCFMWKSGGVKPMNGEALQMVLWESDQSIVRSKQGNSGGGKGLAEEPLGAGTHLLHSDMVKEGNKTGLITSDK